MSYISLQVTKKRSLPYCWSYNYFHFYYILYTKGAGDLPVLVDIISFNQCVFHRFKNKKRDSTLTLFNNYYYHLTFVFVIELFRHYFQKENYENVISIKLTFYYISFHFEIYSIHLTAIINTVSFFDGKCDNFKFIEKYVKI